MCIRDRGKLVVYGGNYDFYERERQIRAREQDAAFSRQQALSLIHISEPTRPY